MGVRSFDFSRMGQSMRKAREARGWTQTYLAQQACMPRAMLCKFETGKRVPTFESFIALAIALDVSLDDYSGFSKR